MLQVKKVREITKDLNNTHDQYPGGYLLYWYLYKKLWIMSRLMPWLVKLNVLIKFPWFCIIKPLGWLYHTRLAYKGVVQMRYVEGVLVSRKNVSLKKNTTYYLCRIPFWMWGSDQLTNADWKRILK